MANSYTLTALDRFPAGTSVGAYPATGYLQSQLPPSGAPPMAASETQTMGTTGATFTTLADGTYYFGASISGTWRFVSGKVSGASAAPVLGGETISDIDVAPGADIASSKLHDGASIPTAGQKNALAGTSGTPGTTNQYVTTQDGRLSDTRTPIPQSVVPASLVGNPNPAGGQSIKWTTGGGGSWVPASFIQLNDLKLVLPNGSTDGTQVQTAIDALASTGGTVVVGAGTCGWNVTPAVPRNLPAPLLFSGYGATVALTAATPRFMDPNKVADGDTIKNVVWEGFTIDRNNIVSNDHIVFGTYRAGIGLSRLNFDNLTFRNLKVVNAPTVIAGTAATSGAAGGAVSAGGGPIVLGLFTYAQSTAQEGANSYSITNITVENCQADGGNGGFQIGGQKASGHSGGNEVPVNCDKVAFRNNRHTFASRLNENSGSSFQCGIYATVGKVTYWGNLSQNGNDTGIESDSAQEALVLYNTIEDCRNSAILSAQFKTPTDAARQSHKFYGNTIRQLNRIPDGIASASGGQPCRGIVLDASITDGEFVARETHYEGTTADKLAAIGGHVFMAMAGSTPRRILVDGFHALLLNTQASNTTGATVKGAPVFINVSSSLGIVQVRNGYIRTTTAGLGTLTNAIEHYGVIITNPAGEILPTVENVGFDMNPGNNANITHGGLYLGHLNASTGVMRGTVVRNVRPLAIYAAGGGATWIRIGAPSLPGRTSIRIRDCDFSAMGNVSQAEIGLDTSSLWNQVFAEAITYKQGFWASSTVTPGASPWTYTNADGYRETLVVQGGVVSKIEIGRTDGGGTTFADTGQTAGAFPLENNDRLKVTYTAVPTVTKLGAK